MRWRFERDQRLLEKGGLRILFECEVEVEIEGKMQTRTEKQYLDLNKIVMDKWREFERRPELKVLEFEDKMTAEGWEEVVSTGKVE